MTVPAHHARLEFYYILFSLINQLFSLINYFLLLINYVMHRKQFVQIDETCSEVKNVNFVVPQAPSWARCYSIFILPIFRTMLMSNASMQHADDTTIYDHTKVSDLNTSRNTIYQSINTLSIWIKESTLAFNNNKTKVKILSTPQMSRGHHFDEYDPNVAVSGYKLELLNPANCLEFTSLNTLSGTITSQTH